MVERVRAVERGYNDWVVTFDDEVLVSYSGPNAREWALQEQKELIELLPQFISRTRRAHERRADTRANPDRRRSSTRATASAYGRRAADRPS